MEEGFYAEDCRANDLAASADGRFFFTADSCGCLNRIDRETGEGTQEYFCDTSNGTHAASLAFVPEAFGVNAGQVATAFAPNGAFAGSASFIDPESQTQTPFVQIDNPITALEFSPDGEFLYALASQIQLVTEGLNIDVQVVSFLYRIELPFMATNVVFGGEGQMFFPRLERGSESLAPASVGTACGVALWTDPSLGCSPSTKTSERAWHPMPPHPPRGFPGTSNNRTRAGHGLETVFGPSGAYCTRCGVVSTASRQDISLP